MFPAGNNNKNFGSYTPIEAMNKAHELDTDDTNKFIQDLLDIEKINDRIEMDIDKHKLLTN